MGEPLPAPENGSATAGQWGLAGDKFPLVRSIAFGILRGQTRVWVRVAIKGSHNTGEWSDPALGIVP